MCVKKLKNYGYNVVIVKLRWKWSMINDLHQTLFYILLPLLPQFA